MIPNGKNRYKLRPIALNRRGAKKPDSFNAG
jgi:hypothetical protein